MNDISSTLLQTTIDNNGFQIGCGCSYCQNGRDHDGLSSDITTPLKDLAVLTGGGGTVTPANIGVNNAAELIHGNEWGPGGGTAANVSYSFVTEVPSYYAVDAREQNNFEAFTTTMQIATRAALDSISEFANITFTEVAGVGDITFGQANLTVSAQDDPTAWAYYPDQGDFSGDVWFNVNDNLTNSMDAGELGYFVALHELGHSLGLIHSFDAGLTGNENTEQFTVMAYNTSPWGNIFAESYMLYDMSAIQAIYGANTAFNSDDTTYTLDPNAALSIWDGGGTDTFDASAVSTGVTIHLEEGGYSSVGLSENIAIAYGAVIENAIGGSGNDALHGNDADNILTGGGGDDQITGGGGQDEAIYSGAFSNYNLTGNLGFFTIEDTTGVDGTDILVDVERFTFSDGYYESGVFTEIDVGVNEITPIVDGVSAAEGLSDPGSLLNGLDEITVFVTVDASQIGTDRGIFDTEGPDGRDDTLLMRYDKQGWSGGGTNVIKIGLQTTEGQMNIESSSNVQTTDVQHIAMTWRSGEALKLYINGVEDVVTFNSGALGGVIDNVQDLFLGIGPKNAGGWSGSIDDFQIFDVALDLTSIQELILGGTNRDPIAADDIFSSIQDLEILGNLLADNGNGVDRDPNGDPLSVVSGIFTTSHGSVDIASSGDFIYTPEAGYVGLDSFNYSLEDNRGGSDIGNVSITIIDPAAITPIVDGVSAAEGLSDPGSLLNGLDEITVFVTVDASQIGTDRGIFDTEGPDGRDDTLLMRYDKQGWSGGGTNVIKIGLQTTEGQMNIESSSNVQTTDVQHIAMTWRSGEALKLYINGVEDVVTFNSGALGGVIDNVQDLFLGIGPKNAGGWSGSIDDFQIFDVALDATGIAALSPLALYDGADTVVFDAISAFTDNTKIDDFNIFNNDSLDISDLLEGYDALTHAITDFVQITDNGSDSILSVDPNGDGAYRQVALLSGATGLNDEEALEISGNLITI